jgi:polysaccharide biosynthesis/export protein
MKPFEALTIWLVFSIGTLLVASAPAMAEYRLQAGDTLEISVTGVPNFRQRLPIELDGKIVLPLVGPLEIAGLPISEARKTITADLSNRVYKQAGIDGREAEHLILPNEIVVSVADFRPIYVSGHVAKPGAYAFRPGLIVRQAIAVAGGSNIAQVGGPAAFAQAADLQAEYETLWADFVAEQDRVWRLKSELAENAEPAPNQNVPIPAKLRERLKKDARQYFDAQVADRKQDKAALQNAIDQADAQLQVLAEKQKKDEQGNKADEDDFNRVRELFKQHVTANARLSEVRRAVLLSSDQLLQTIIDISNVQRQRGEYERQLKKIDTQARIDELRELQAANLRLVQIEARLKSTGSKLTYIDNVQTSRRLVHPTLRITVYRQDGEGSERLAAKEDTTLMPGDVVEVTMTTAGTGVADDETSGQNVR